MKRALVTVNYNKMMCNNTRESMVHAAVRWGAEYHEFTEANHSIHLHPATVKTEAFTLVPDADAVFIIDSDAIIREDCPNPFEYHPSKDFTVVGISPRVDPSGSNRVCGKLEWDRLCGISKPLPYDNWIYFNSGVMLAFREHHKAMFDLAFELCHIPNDLGWIEQTPLNYAAKKLGVSINYVSEDWNYIGTPFTRQLNAGNKVKMDKWIWHFAGSPNREWFMENIIWQTS